MEFLDIFRKRGKPKQKEKPAEKPEMRKKEGPEEIRKEEESLKVEVLEESKKKSPVREKEEPKPEIAKPTVKISDLAYRILKSPHVSEKATELAKKNQYVFKIWPKANKIEIKKAIEGLYGVEVLGVKIIKILPKKRRLGRIEGFRKGYKKAIVRIKEGQKIEVLPR